MLRTMHGIVGLAVLMLLSQIGEATEERVSYDYYKYHPMPEIITWMVQIKTAHSDVVELIDYGKTFEKRNITLLKIGIGTGKVKKAVWLDCGIHAREWIAPAFCQYFVQEILQTYNSNKKIKEMLTNMDFYVTPVLNVDGYIYSWTDNTTRLWRKSMSPSPVSNCACKGTDLNRNFNVNWATVGVSTNCCSETYPGAKALSESEAEAVVQFVEERKNSILCFLTIHSYGQLILVPYGHPNVAAPNYEELMEVGLAAANSIMKVHGTSFTVGTSADVLYPNSGSSRDWARLIGIPYSFTFELRDKGEHGFQLPEDQIQASCEEAYMGALSIVTYVHDKTFSGASVVTVSLWTTLGMAYITSSLSV